MCRKNCIIIFVIINIIVYIVVVLMCQNHQVIGTSFGCCWYSGGTPKSPDFGSPCNVRGKMGAGEWREIALKLLKMYVRMAWETYARGWCKCLWVQVFCLVMVVAKVMGVMLFLEKLYLVVTNVELDCLGMSFGLVGGDIFDLGGGFIKVVVEMEMDDLELEVGVVVRRVLFVAFGSNVSERENF